MKTLRILLAVVFVSSVAAFAMPPHPDLMVKVRALEVAVPYGMTHRAELLARGVDAPQPFDLSAKKGSSGRLDDTDMYLLILLAEFSDQTYQTDAVYFDSLIFGNGLGDMRHYYHEVSYNEFHLLTGAGQSPSQIGWTMMPNNYGYYVDGQNGFGSYPRNAQGLVVELVQAVDPIVDFSRYDNDGNGTVDGLMIVHTGPGAEYTGSPDDIWSHAWSVPTQYVDGVTVRGYSMEPEYWSHSGDMTCGVYCHEFGHQLGLPDLYDYDYDSEGVGKFSLMAGGSWNGSLGNRPAHLDAWSKTRAGFATATVLSADATGIATPLSEYSPTMYRVWRDGVGTGYEYFLIENRGPFGYDVGLQGAEGLFIWHIEEASGNNDNQWYPGYTDFGHYLVALEQADGDWGLEHNQSGDPGDPYPGTTNNRTFSSTSVPNSRDYAFEPTDVMVDSISDPDSVMTFDLSLQPQPFLDILEPNGGEVWPIALGATISLERYAITGSAIISLSRNGGGSWTEIFTLAGSETTWIVTGPTTTQALLKAEIYGDDTLSDVSDNTFIIGDVVLTIMTPNGGDTVVAGQPYRITWGSYGYSGSVSLLLNRDYPDGQWDTLSANISNNGSRQVRILRPPSNACRIRVVCDENPEIYDESDGDFTLLEPFISILAPNGGEEFQEGDTVTVQWTSENLESDAQVRISISRNGATGPWEVIFTTTWNDGVQTWIASGAASEHCRIRVESRYDSLTADISDADFTIQGESAGDHPSQLPLEFGIASVFPNPFNSVAEIRFTLDRPGLAIVTIFDLLGREVKRIETWADAPGHYQVSWQADVASGLYFAELRQGARRDLAKLAFLK